MMAGGTGGHVFPALAVARRLRDEGVQVLWIGTRRGFEATAVPAAGFDIAWINVAGIRGKSWREWLLAPLQLLRALLQALQILRRFRPALVMGMGGYAAGPGGLAAWMLRRPLIIHEQNAAAGTTNRLLSRLATQVVEAYPDTFPASAKRHTLGNPVRAELIDLPAPAARGVAAGSPLRILVLGGSLGALALNRLVPAALARMSLGLQVTHQAGRTLEQAQAAYAQAGVSAKVVGFIDDMATALAQTDLLICRAGALTLAEVATVGVASVLVPLPHAIDDHQTRNAEHLVAAGAAVMAPEAGLDAERLAAILQDMLSDPSRLLAMAVAARACAKPQATEAIAALCRPYLQVAA